MTIGVATGTHRTKLLSSVLAVLNAAAAVAGQRLYHFKFRVKLSAIAIGQTSTPQSLTAIYTSIRQLLTRSIDNSPKK